MGRRYPSIGDYAVIGDCRTAALVSMSGSIDWLCLPRFDGPSIFAALLDARAGGRLAVGPARQAGAVIRRYLPGTAVLETTFSTDEGLLRVTDAMTIAGATSELRAATEIIRRVEVLEGEVDVEVVFDPRPDYGRREPRIRPCGQLGFLCAWGSEAVILRCDVPLEEGRGGGLRGTQRLAAGQRRHVALGYDAVAPSVIPPLGAGAESAIESSAAWWRAWAKGFRYDGGFRDHVLRSAITLKLMTFASSGAVVAAPTTSLPEAPGGVRNWDYRYCWLRDASVTLRALFDLGFTAEGEAFLSWMLHTTRLTWPQLHVLYDVHGRTHTEERELGHLEGYAGSRPVLVGNDAGHQLQLDVYGEVIEAAYRYASAGAQLDRVTGRMLAGLGRTVMRSWREPDEGIWEVRSGRRHHTYSRAMCWVALDRLARLAQAGSVDVDSQELRRERDAIAAEIEERGYSRELGSYVSVLDGGEVDASLLLLGLHGYAPWDSDRMRGTVSRILERLGAGDALLFRYLAGDGLPGAEGAFGICGFWAVECLARIGEVGAARSRFERLLAYGNDVGLFGEEIDPATGAALGNFPQAYTHVGLINAALTLEEYAGRPHRAGRERASVDAGRTR